MICYFSATGNSKRVAERIAEAIGESAVSIEGLNPEEVSGKCLNLVTPVYFWTVPNIVQEFLRSISPSELGFMVITYGTTTGHSKKDAEEILGRGFSSYYQILMPDTWIYSSVKAEECRTREACLSYELAIQNAYSEVRDAYAAYTQEQHRCEALKSAVKAAQDAVAIANDLYKNGLRDFTAVIDAQRSLLTLSESLVISRGDITQDLITLCRALGGGIGQNGPEASSDGDASGQAESI